MVGSFYSAGKNSVTSASMEISMSSFRKLKHKLYFGLDMLLLRCMHMNQGEYNSNIYLPVFLKVLCKVTNI